MTGKQHSKEECKDWKCPEHHYQPTEKPSEKNEALEAMLCHDALGGDWLVEQPITTALNCTYQGTDSESCRITRECSCPENFTRNCTMDNCPIKHSRSPEIQPGDEDSGGSHGNRPGGHAGPNECKGCWFKTEFFCKTYCGFYAPSGDGIGGERGVSPAPETAPKGDSPAPETPEGDIDLSSCTFTTKGLRPDPNFLISKHHGKNAGILVVSPAPEKPVGLPNCVKYDCDCSDRAKDDKCECPRRDTPDGCEHYAKPSSGGGTHIDVDAGIADEIGKDIHHAPEPPKGPVCPEHGRNLCYCQQCVHEMFENLPPCPHPSFAVVHLNDNETEPRCAHCFETLPFFWYMPEDWAAHKRDFKSPVAASGACAVTSIADSARAPVDTAGDVFVKCLKCRATLRMSAPLGVFVCPNGCGNSFSRTDMGDLPAGRRWLQRRETGDKIIYDIIPCSGYKWLAKNYKIGPRIEVPSDDEFHEVSP